MVVCEEKSDKVLRADGAVVVHACDGVGKEAGHTQHGHLGAFFHIKGNTVGEHELGELAVHDAFAGGVAHDGM